MEVELKYLIDDRRKVPEIFREQAVVTRAEGREVRKIPMHAVYYDTREHALTRQHIAFRVRKEGDQQVATVKWGGGSEHGMHRRGEKNIPMPADGSTPDMALLKGDDIWEMIGPIVEEHALIPLMTMDFMRLEVELREGETRCMLSADLGEIIVGANKSTIPGFSEETIEGVNQAIIQEMEIELICGEEKILRQIGEEIAGKFDLRPCDISKFQRGFALIR